MMEKELVSDNIQHTNIRILGAPEDEEREQGLKTYFKKTAVNKDVFRDPALKCKALGGQGQV